MIIVANDILTVSEQVYGNRDYVFVQPPDGVSGSQSRVVTDESGVHDFWVGRILEIRAKDEDHVYARVIADDHSIMLELTFGSCTGCIGRMIYPI